MGGIRPVAASASEWPPARSCERERVASGPLTELPYRRTSPLLPCADSGRLRSDLRPFLMPRFTTLFGFLIMTALTLRAAPANAFLRPGLNLNGQWHLIVDPYDNGYLDYRLQPFDALPSRAVAISSTGSRPPRATWWSTTSTRPGPHRAGRLELPVREAPLLRGDRLVPAQVRPAAVRPGHRHFLYFGAANYEAEVYLNGRSSAGTSEASRRSSSR